MDKINRLSILLVMFSCNNGPDIQNFQAIHKIDSIVPYQDVRWGDLSEIESSLDTNIIKTFWYNEKTVWPEKYSSYAKKLLTLGKNPGLGIREIHEEGINGTGITVAIIDQNICLDHPEFEGKIIEYYDVGCNQPANESSMHGPAVASLLVGDSIGTAPGAKIYFVAAPSWTKDAKYQADALNWIIDKNRTLPEGNKIKAVSISAAPSGPGSPFDKNKEMWDSAYARACNEGILIVDCTANNGFTMACYYNINSPEDVNECTLGWPGIDFISDTTSNRIYVPTSFRTTAEEYDEGKPSYQYHGRGGLSWAEPYLVGVCALGWQIRNDISANEMVTLLRKSAFNSNQGGLIINPKAFIDSVKTYSN